jgi:hypothetical protein
MSKILGHMDAVAIRKSGIEGWEPYKYERVGDDSLITGGIPRVLTRGPRKGRKTWDGKGTSVVVTSAEVAAQAASYAAETGNCDRCFGEKIVFARWSKAEGKKYRPCTKCSETGRATTAEAVENSQPVTIG